MALRRLSLLLWASVAAALECYDCEGQACFADTCHGDYCVVTAFTPIWASHKFSERRIIKGCVKGSLLKKGIPTQCETVPDHEQYITNCFCADKDFCNKNVKIHPKKDVKFVKCACDGDDDCNGPTRGSCLGEYCTILRDTTEAKEMRGCVNSSASLIERRGDGAVVQPPLTGGIHHEEQGSTAGEELLRTEAFMCSSDWCNNEWPTRLQPRTLHCPTFFELDLKPIDSAIKTGNGCLGEYCWNVSISTTDNDSMFRGYKAGGCMTLLPGGKISDEYNKEGCLDFSSEKFRVNACFHTDAKRVVALEEKPTKTKEAEKSVHKAKPKEVKEEKDSKAKSNHHKKPEHRHEKQKHKASPAHKKLDASEELDEEEAAGNATLITVFVFIIIGIVGVGIAWKFNIHRRLFRARYETVAG